MEANKDSAFVALIKHTYKALGNNKLITKNYFYLERGAYDIAAVMDENGNDKPLIIQGPVIDLFNPALPILSQKIVQPGQQSFLYDLKRMKDKQTLQVLCAAARMYGEKRSKHSYSFVAKSPDSTNNVMRVLLPAKPQSIVVKNAGGNVVNNASFDWDEASHTCLLKFMNASDGRSIVINW